MHTDPYFRVVKLHLADVARDVERGRDGRRPVARTLRRLARSVRRPSR